MAKKNQEPVQFNDRLILFRYFLKQLGKDSLKELSKTLNSSEYEGYDENQNTWFYVYLKRFCSDNGLNGDKLRIYDENICRYVKKIGENRDGGIVLKYYQYISLLFTEMYLDRYFSDRDAFIKDLNSFIDEVSVETLGKNSFTHYTAETMNKLAYMCATGSGKTLIMHINILQFLHYLKRARRTNSHIGINKIIVLSPNEGMSNQHLAELKLSSISANLFSKDLSGFSASKEDVIVIDMNKLKEEGKVKTVSVDSFEQNNLVLVDEGHRGLTGDVWKEYRDKLSAEGFAFEYSATFKQALKSQKAKDMESLMDEYGKAIIMDYSYKYFYEDGYGKDYRIYNLKENVTEEYRQTYLVGCLMSFYQQLKLFKTYKKEFAPFRIEKPLLVFVGNRVTAPIIKKSSLSVAEKELLTDVEQVLQFIDDFVKNKDKTIKRINALINEDTGLTDSAGNELFYQDFNGINTIFGTSISAEMVYEDIMRCIFNSDSVPDQPRLHIVNLRQIDGEIALKIGEYNDYFGVISVGDTAALVKKCADDGMVTDTEEFYSDSLFSSINSKDSDINILVGSRKFSEGWNSWRVSTMGLINFAKGEGSQAIQLFGRGVRLRGYEGCLKRSSKVDKKINVPEMLRWLETLTIFGIKAQYMEDFKKYLEMEDLSTNETVHEFKLPILSRFNDIKDKKLQVIQLPKDKVFKKQAKRMILTAPDDGFFTYLNKHKIVVDCRSKVQTIESNSSLHFESTTKEHTLDKRILPYLNYSRVYEELQRYKNEKFYYNITIDKSLLKDIMEYDGWYSLIIPKTHIQIDSVMKLEDATDYAIMVLKIYMDKFFVYNKEKWEEPYMSYFELDGSNNNFESEYTIRYTNINDNDTQAEAIKAFIADVTNTLEKNKCIPGYSMATNHDIITAFDFKNHLYAPLVHLNAGSLKIQVSPVQMNDGEMKFVSLLKDYLERNPDVLGEKELYLLRNKSKVGMGFFEAGNFYPDFILWIKEQGLQRISFIDPKGLLKLMPNDPKIEFHKTIKELQARLQDKLENEKVILNSFIMSITPSQSLKEWWMMSKPEREAKNVLCLDNDDCIEVMLKNILNDTI